MSFFDTFTAGSPRSALTVQLTYSNLLIEAGVFPSNVFVAGTFPKHLFAEYGLAAPSQSASRLRQIIAKMESQTIGDYCFGAGCVEPGIDNVNTIMRRIITKMETT